MSAQIITCNVGKFALIELTIFMTRFYSVLQHNGSCTVKLMVMRVLYMPVPGIRIASHFMKMCFFLRYLLALMCQEYLSIYLSSYVFICHLIVYLLSELFLCVFKLLCSQLFWIIVYTFFFIVIHFRKISFCLLPFLHSQWPQNPCYKWFSKWNTHMIHPGKF